MIVVDTNIITYFLLNSEHTEPAEQVYTKDSAWAAPVLWRSEFRNVLAGYLRRDLLSFSEVSRVSTVALRLMSGREHLPRHKDVLQLVSSSDCSAYDCEFVAVAQRLDVPLVTADHRLLTCFPSVAVSPDVFVRGM